MCYCTFNFVQLILISRIFNKIYKRENQLLDRFEFFVLIITHELIQLLLFID